MIFITILRSSTSTCLRLFISRIGCIIKTFVQLITPMTFILNTKILHYSPITWVIIPINPKSYTSATHLFQFLIGEDFSFHILLAIFHIQ